jgi:3-oxoacyl-[acyl-carrier protein] reductase
VLDVNLVDAQRVATAIKQTGGRAEAICCDVTDEDQVAAGVARLVEIGGGITILINNAGITDAAMFGDMDNGRFERVLDVHVRGSLYCTRRVLPHMPTDGTGRVIMVTSAAGIQGTVGQVNYAAAKAALIGMAKSLAKELGRQQITVNAIAPLAVTEMTKTVRTDERFATQYLSRITLGRWGTEDDIAPPFVFLASDDARYITGQVLCVDGGMVF